MDFEKVCRFLYKVYKILRKYENFTKVCRLSLKYIDFEKVLGVPIKTQHFLQSLKQ